MAQCRMTQMSKKENLLPKKKPRMGTLQPTLRVRVGSWVEISNPHPPRWQPMRQTRGFAQPVINPSQVVRSPCVLTIIWITDILIHLVYLAVMNRFAVHSLRIPYQ
jgi:hypothetical protein